jgi:putative DNA primase/helicase
VKAPLTDGWEVLVTEAGRTGRGIKATLMVLNGEPKACHSIALGNATEQDRFAEAVYNLCGADEETVKVLIPKLAYLIEGVLLQMREKQGEEDDLPGKALTFDDPEPWDAPVDGAALLDALRATYTRFVVLPPGAAEALALWTLHTYVTDAVDITPYLILTSPQKRSGKSTTLTVASVLCHKALTTNNISAAALFRTIEACTPTLFIDEADSFANESNELRGVLNSGHTRRTAFVIRTVGENHEPRQFCTWSPKMIAGIGNLPDTVRDRAITLSLKRRTKDEVIEKWQEEMADQLTVLRRQCLRWSEDNLSALRTCRPDVPETLHDRAADNWRPLCAIAAVVDGEWPRKAQTAISALESLDESEDDNVVILLLSDLRSIFRQGNQPNIFTDTILDELKVMEERPWAEWGKARKPMNPRQLAQVLKPFAVKSKTVRIDNVTAKGYEKSDFDDIFSRYLPSPAVTASHMSNDVDLRENSIRHTTQNVTDEKSRKPSPEANCDGVTDKTGGNPENKDFSADTPCPQRGCIGRLKLITGNAVMCGACDWTPEASQGAMGDWEEF